MKTPYFSIIIPTLNEQNYLPNLLENLKNQTFQDFEVIVVDGNSKDKTQEIVNQYKNKLLISNKKNVAYQRNIGGKEAKGEYLIFFDADIQIPNYFLENINQKLMENPQDLFSSNMKSSKKIIDQIIIFIGNQIRKLSIYLNKPMLGGMFLGCKKSSFLKTEGFNENMYLCEDHDFCNKFAKQKLKIKLFDKPKFEMSFRRFNNEGYLKVVNKYIFSLMLYLTNNNHHQNKIIYSMGGDKN